jgi:hypothetical protein
MEAPPMLTRWGRGRIAAAIVLPALVAPPLGAGVSACAAPPAGGAIMDKIDQALQARLKAGAAGRVAVIVTFTGAIDYGQLQSCGLDVAHRFEAIGAVSGTIAASEVPRLAALAGVKSVELDGEMRASAP